ncbi:MAG: hypothetical protein ACREC9_15665 [Methylocella sp.]
MFELLLGDIVDPETVRLGFLTAIGLVALVTFGLSNPDFNMTSAKPRRPAPHGSNFCPLERLHLSF